jgi:hypothetical protein
MTGESGRFAVTPARAVEDRRLGDAAYRLLACLGTYSDRDGWCWPSMATLAQRLSITRQAVQQRIDQLTRCGYLEIHRQHRADGGTGTNRYRLLFDRALFRVQEDMPDETRPPQADLAGPATPPCAPRKIDPKSPVPPYKEERTHKNVHGRSGDLADAAKQFQTFWRAYPSRGGHTNPKKPALEKFLAALKCGVDASEIILAAENYAAHVARSGTAPQHVAQAKTWLNQECWEQYAEAFEPEPLRPGLI